MPKQKYYAVRKGRAPGIYQTWDACSAQVTGFPGAIYKSFESRAEAERFLRAAGPQRPSRAQPGGPKAAPRALSAAQPGPTEPAPDVDASAGRASRSPQRSAGGAEPAASAHIYTDGGCLVNPGPGGYGVVLFVAAQRRELSGGFRRTTNNRMELMACIVGLEALSAGAWRASRTPQRGVDGGEPPTSATIYTDSKYLANGIGKGWAKRWQAMHWEREGEPVPNADLWQRLLALCAQRTISFEWLRGHAGHPENERCHLLADEAMRRPSLPPDPGYESA